MSEEPFVVIDDNIVKKQNQQSTHIGSDGERSSTPGRCPCGYKHWLKGVEYDCVIRPNGFNALLGFNIGDNHYLLAEKFVIENDTTKTLNHRNLINGVVNDITAIIDKLLPPPPQPETREHSTFDPMKASISIPTKNLTHYNPVTKTFERTTYAVNNEFQQKATPEEIAENVRKLKLLNEEARKREEEEQRKNKMTAHITDKVRRDREEVERDQEKNRLLMLNSHTTDVKPHGSVARLKDGKIEWVSPEKQPPPERDNLTSSPGPLKTLKDLSPDSSHHHLHHHHPHDHVCEHCHQSHPPPPTYAVHFPTNQPPVAFKIDGLEDFENLLKNLPKDVWPEELILKFMKRDQHPYHRTRHLMAQCGFTTDEIAEQITLASLRLQVKSSKKHRHHHDDEHYSPTALTTSYEDPLHQTKPVPYHGGFTLGTTSTGTTTPQKTKHEDRETSTLTSPSTTTTSTTTPPSTPISLISVDSSSPTTSIRVRLMNSNLVTITVNHHHTVQQIIDHIRIISDVSGPFKLIDAASMPRKVLTDGSLTVLQANLLKGQLQQAP